MGSSTSQKVVVLGCGYVGLPMALLMAKVGLKIVGIDINPRVVDAINRGEPHIVEPGLPELMTDPTVRQNLSASLEVPEGDVFIIAVPTPLQSPRYSADLSMVEAAGKALAPKLRAGNLVILESTVPPRTCRDLLAPIFKQYGFEVGKNLLMAHCPERVLPGRALHEIVNNDRIVGGCDLASTDAAASLYATFVKGELVRTDDVTAELIKLMENTFRDVNIALANELADVAASQGVNILEAIAIANRHPRVNILQPGIGVGGHCIPIDPWFIAEAAPSAVRLIPVARKINDERPSRVAAAIRRNVRDIADPVIVCAGVTYKPDIDDLRESPAMETVHLLQEDGYQVRVFDSLSDKYNRTPLAEVAKGADLIVVLVDHQVLKQQLADNDQLGALTRGMRTPRVIDLSAGATVPREVTHSK